MIRQRARVLLILLAALALASTACKKEDEESGSEEEGGAAAAEPSAAEPGTAAEVAPVGDSAAQTELLKAGLGKIDAAVAMRMMGDSRPQKVIFRPGPLVDSGLVDGVFQSFPPAKAVYDEAVEDAGGVDLMGAIDLAVVYSDVKTVDTDAPGASTARFDGVIVTRGDALSELVGAIETMDGEDAPGDETRGEIHLVFAGELDAAAVDTVMKEFDATTPDITPEREDLADGVALMVEVNGKGDGHNYLYAWPHGIIFGRTLAEGAPMEAARTAAATKAREVEAGVKGSGGGVPDDLVLDIAMTIDAERSFDLALSASDTLDLKVTVPLKALGPEEERKQQLQMIKMVTAMPEDKLREMVGSNLPPTAVDAAMIVLDTLSIEEEGDDLVVSASPEVDALISALPKGE